MNITITDTHIQWSGADLEACAKMGPKHKRDEYRWADRSTNDGWDQCLFVTPYHKDFEYRRLISDMPEGFVESLKAPVARETLRRAKELLAVLESGNWVRFNHDAAGSASRQHLEKILAERFAESLTAAQEAIAQAKELLREIRDGEVNPEDEADKFLRDHAPSKLSEALATIARLEREKAEQYRELHGIAVTKDRLWSEACNERNDLRQRLEKAEAALQRYVDMQTAWEKREIKLVSFEVLKREFEEILKPHGDDARA